VHVAVLAVLAESTVVAATVEAMAALTVVGRAA